ncbi:MAG TPA: LysM peptidoglycan-binding domain-containing protein [Anaerolineaceae bacterium]
MDPASLSEMDRLPLSPVRRCPFLGVRADKTTYSACEEQPNFCHRSAPISSVSHERQAQVCCGTKHHICPIFSGIKPGHGFPVAWTNRNARRNLRLRPWVLVGVTLGVLFMAVIGAIFRTQLVAVVYGSSLTSSPISTASFTSTLTQALIPISKRALTNTTSLTRPAAPSLTASPVPTAAVRPLVSTPGPALETPFGAPQTFLVHRVKAGEYLTSIAASYQTSLAVLRAVSGLNPNAILATGALLVITPGQTSPSGLLALKPLLLTVRTRVADLAKTYAMADTELRQLNALGPGDWVEPGRYVIVHN